MPQSLVKNYVHIVFSTKNREPFIYPPYEQELHAYIGSICNELESPAIIVGGYVDHIHILCSLSRKLPLMTLVQKVKANSSKWFKTKHEELEGFFWQEGYGGFSVNPTEVEVVVQYIKNQHTYHRKKDFKDEFRAFLKKYKVNYDEQYLWD